MLQSKLLAVSMFGVLTARASHLLTLLGRGAAVQPGQPVWIPEHKKSTQDVLLFHLFSLFMCK